MSEDGGGGDVGGRPLGETAGLWWPLLPGAAVLSPRCSHPAASFGAAPKRALVLAVASAPAWSKTSTTSLFPKMEAMWSGVAPNCSSSSGGGEVWGDRKIH